MSKRGCRMDLNSLPLKYQRQAYHQLANGKPKENDNSAADTVANVEPAIGKQPMATKENPRYDTPCRISIHSIRKQLADPDGISGKAVIDGLVRHGILGDDTAKEIKEPILSTQEKGKEEKTIITIEPIQ